MPVYNIALKTDALASIGPVTIGTETNVVNVAAQSADYIPEVYVDLSNMNTGDTTIVTEYIAVDGVNFRIFYQSSFSGAQTVPILRFHGKLIELNNLYKITVKQTSGTGRAYPYSYVLQVFNL